jgi:hypothetical protein
MLGISAVWRRASSAKSEVSRTGRLLLPQKRHRKEVSDRDNSTARGRSRHLHCRKPESKKMSWGGSPGSPHWKVRYVTPGNLCAGAHGTSLQSAGSQRVPIGTLAAGLQRPQRYVAAASAAYGAARVWRLQRRLSGMVTNIGEQRQCCC